MITVEKAERIMKSRRNLLMILSAVMLLSCASARGGSPDTVGYAGAESRSGAGVRLAPDGMELVMHGGVMRYPSETMLPAGVSRTGGYSMTSLYPWWDRDISGHVMPARIRLELAVDSIISLHASGAVLKDDSAEEIDALRWFEGSTELWDGGSHSVNRGRLDISRAELYLPQVAGRWDVIAGRMPVGFGTSRHISVLDIMAPPATTQVYRGHRPGVDLLRVRGTMFETGEGELLLVGTRPWDSGAAVVRLRMISGYTDYEALAGRFRGRGLLGLAWDNSRGQRSIWGELAFTESTVPDAPGFAGMRDRALHAIVGLERWTGISRRVGIALHHCSQGAKKTEELPEVYASAAFQDGSIPLAGRNHLVLSFSVDPNPLQSNTASAILNLHDRSMLLQPQISRSLADESTLTLYANITTGSSATTFSSEFGAMPWAGGVIYSLTF